MNRFAIKGKALLGVGSMVLPGIAAASGDGATTIDTSAVTSQVDEASTAIVAVGGAVVAVAAVAMAFRWIKGMLS